jgi:hypothetical protein
MTIKITEGAPLSETYGSASAAADHYHYGTLFEDGDGDPCLLTYDGDYNAAFILFMDDEATMNDRIIKFPVKLSNKTVTLSNNE